MKQRFKNSFGENIFRFKYAQGPADTWDNLAERLVEDVCGTRWGKDRALMSGEDRAKLTEYIKQMKFIPGGRYLYYAGRMNSFFNNCFLLRGEEDTREEWGELVKRSTNCLYRGSYLLPAQIFLVSGLRLCISAQRLCAALLSKNG